MASDSPSSLGRIVRRISWARSTFPRLVANCTLTTPVHLALRTRQSIRRVRVAHAHHPPALGVPRPTKAGQPGDEHSETPRIPSDDCSQMFVTPIVPRRYPDRQLDSLVDQSVHLCPERHAFPGRWFMYKHLKEPLDRAAERFHSIVGRRRQPGLRGQAVDARRTGERTRIYRSRSAQKSRTLNTQFPPHTS